MTGRAQHQILVVDDDVVLSDLVRAVLTDEGYAVSVLNVVQPDAVRVAIEQLEPDCVLLDSSDLTDYGTSWDTAAWARARGRAVPAIMFTAHGTASAEAQAAETARARAAGFAAVVPKPFDLDQLLGAVERCAQLAPVRAENAAEHAERAQVLQAKLEAAGASDIDVSRRKEWATFQTDDGTVVQLYWWRRDGVYYVLRFGNGEPRLVGRFHELDAAIALAMTVRERLGFE